MIEMMFDESLLGDFSRPRSSDVYFKAFKTIGDDVFGQGSQLVTNAGTSMLTNTAGTIPEILELYNSHIKIDSLAIKYCLDTFNYKDRVDLSNLDTFVSDTEISEFIENQLPNLLDEPVYNDIRENYIRYKKDKCYRKEINKFMFLDMETLTLNKNLPLAFLFIIYAIYIFKNNNFMSNTRDKNYAIASKYYSSQSEFVQKYSEVLDSSDDLIDLTDCCNGQYRFVDYHLSAVSDVKALPLVLVHLLIDNSLFLKRFLLGKVDKVRSSRRKT
ncbi:hypothetical protein NSA27_06800 [Clostridium tepidum]|jgi:hypothetical protein|uniref:hypothetical protein n=1 Tax=Clostridium tepidum TaxID=1962263 RepID=UPI00214A6F31|nr:hypothetical protein [Clostridium tepidum]MCR1934401.1 hypothetical protein [Clostridium tepidum]